MSMKSRIAQRWAGAEKTARLLKRHIKILDKFLDGGYGPKFRGFETVLWDDLPPRVRADLERVKNTETLWSDAERYISDELYNRARMWSRSASEKTALAKTKNKRVFLDLRGTTLILDFRGDSGMRALDPKKLQNMYRDFFIEVVNTEKALSFPSTSRGHSTVEVFQGELGFHVQRWYKWDDTAEYLHEDLDGEYSTRDIMDAIKDALSHQGWKATVK